jgi:beta-galactosidase/beta-glucuronidase
VQPEHPRPDFVRERWLTLNGAWEFRFDPLDEGMDQEWWKPGTAFDQRINVPFGWESELSGFHSTSGQQIAWYRRELEVPPDWDGQHAWLRFEAVDWEARVWVNGAEVGGHEGGYTPFAFDLTGQAAPGSKAVIVVLGIRYSSLE